MGATELCRYAAAEREAEAASMDCGLGMLCPVDAIFHLPEMASVVVESIRHEG